MLRLHDFILAHQEQIIETAKQRVRQRTPKRANESKLEHGVPIFLTQLIAALRTNFSGQHTAGVSPEAISDQIVNIAELHGYELLRNDFSVAQVVHGYGDICQIVTKLASETNAEISADDFHVFNRCLDNAIAGAVTSYGRQHERDVSYESTERLGIFAHELRNLLNTAVLSFDVIRRGMVGLSGSTGAIHARSLAGLRALIERSIAEVRLEAGVPLLERVLVSDFIWEVADGAAMEAEGRGIELVVGPIDSEIAVAADRQLLASALLNILQNAFKFTKPHSTVLLSVRTAAERVLVDIADQCGGLPEGKAEELFRPFVRKSLDTSGLGLGLAIARSAVSASGGDIYVRNVPGIGCVFTIDLPRRASLPVEG